MQTLQESFQEVLIMHLPQRETLCVQPVQEALPNLHAPECTQENPHWGEAIQAWDLWVGVELPLCPEESHANSLQGVALCLPGMQVGLWPVFTTHPRESPHRVESLSMQ